MMNDLVDLEQKLLLDLSQINTDILDAKMTHHNSKKKLDKKYLSSAIGILEAKGMNNALDIKTMSLMERLKMNTYTEEDLIYIKKFIEKI